MVCISVKLQALIPITDKCYKAIDFAGNEALLPKSQVVGQDYEKSDDNKDVEAWWISEWILQQKNIQYSQKRKAWFDKGSQNIKIMYPIIVEHHTPEVVSFQEIQPQKDLER